SQSRSPGQYLLELVLRERLVCPELEQASAAGGDRRAAVRHAVEVEYGEILVDHDWERDPGPLHDLARFLVRSPADDCGELEVAPTPAEILHRLQLALAVG